jgi:Outer membrane protein beta-barrel domain
LIGISATQISGDNLGGFDKAGLVAGGMVSTKISEKFDMAMEITFFQKGSKENSDPEKGDYTSYNLRLNYFEVPVLFQWLYSKRFTFEAGPTFGALLSSKEENELGEIPWDPPRPFDNFELGITGGMRVHFAQNFSSVFRLSSSVLPVRPHQSGQSYRANYGQYNAALFLGLQYTFKKKNE